MLALQSLHSVDDGVGTPTGAVTRQPLIFNPQSDYGGEWADIFLPANLCGRSLSTGRIDSI